MPKLTPKCPAARAGKFADSGQLYIRCAIEQQYLSIADAPAAIEQLCCGDHTICPTWRAHKENDPVIDRQRQAIARRERDRITQRQIETGLRADDRDSREVEELFKEEEASEERRDTELERYTERVMENPESKPRIWVPRSVNGTD